MKIGRGERYKKIKGGGAVISGLILIILKH